jgi:ribosomal protein S18 acetylase RimI-like enzyme
MPNSPLEAITIRPMREADLHAVLAVQAACYPPPMQEPEAVVLQRLRAAPATVLVAGDAAGVCAYVFAYPSRLGAVTPLGAGFAPALDADTLYIHDLAVAPRALGRGLARGLVASLLARAAALPYAALVAVQGTRGFWEAQGFTVRDPGQGSARALASYPAGALYMARVEPGLAARQ